VYAAFRHQGAARRLVHRLKYQGLVAAADVLATAMTRVLPPGATALVPAPRALIRRLHAGVDPARILAHRVSVRTGLPVVDALGAGWWWPRHAGADRGARSAPRFVARHPIPSGAVVVDDVVTSGATVAAARVALGAHLRLGMAATSPGTMVGRGEDDHPYAGEPEPREDVWRVGRMEDQSGGPSPHSILDTELR
jgi:predicted amidophosphoribosyltransferase